MHIDLNADMGESFGAYVLGTDAEMLEQVSSANVACGFHAGDPQVMRRTVALARARGVAVGAHPGYPDLVGFGRREMQCTADEVTQSVLYQVAALGGFCRAEGVALHHVKPHGALYNQAARDAVLAGAIVAGIKAYDPGLILFALPDSELAKAGVAAGLPVVLEGFADRAYNADGSLVSRRLPGALLHDPGAIATRILRLVQTGSMICADGQEISLPVQTICIHGDNPQAPAIARTLRSALLAAGVAVAPPGVSLPSRG